MSQATANTADQHGEATAMPARPVASEDDQPSPLSRTSLQDTEGQIYAGREWTADHPLNIRVSIPVGFSRYYITLVAGKERRARARLALDRRQHPLDKPGNVFFLALISIIATAGGITVLYLLLAHLFGWSGRLIL